MGLLQNNTFQGICQNRNDGTTPRFKIILMIIIASNDGIAPRYRIT
jgi:hypothetical protein